MKRIIYDLNEEECIQLLEKVKWKNGVFCPHRKSKEKRVKNGHFFIFFPLSLFAEMFEKIFQLFSKK